MTQQGTYMQASLETISTLERKMTIAVPAERVESQVQNRLNEAARTINIKGFRPGKVPVKVVKERYGQSVRQEVLGELMSQTFYEALGEHKVRPASQPRIEAKSVAAGADLQFVAIFEVYPEITLGDLSTVNVDRKVAEISDADIDKMVETLRKQRQTWQEVDRPAAEGDQVVIDFTGKLDGQPFDGGSATGSRLILGSNRMIDGFEAGIVGMTEGQEKVLSLSFPANYHKQELAGKPVEFTVKLTKLSEPVLPELDVAFFASFDVKNGGEADFRTEVKANMAREMKNAVRNNIKNQVVSELLRLHTVELPKSLVASEINQMRHQAIQQYGNNRNIDEASLPAELFAEQAQRRVSLGLIMNEVVQQSQLRVDPAAVRKLVEEMAESYEQPQEVVKWYYSNKEQLAQIEAMALEEAVIDHILGRAMVVETSCTYEDALKPATA
jgi:trigger factor